MDAWRSKSAAEQGRAIQSGTLDPRELVESYLDAIDAHPASGEIYARVMPERARAEAAAASQRAKEGALLGPLDGVPISWKDLFDTAGVATEGGTRLLKGRVPDADCLVLKRAGKSGSVCLGKTHTSELAFSGLGVNPMTATSPNSQDPTLAPGGSSSGAAVSTALGLAAGGIGSDTGGSVRIPSAWNNLVGLKTTAGLIPTDGVIALSRTYDTIGALVRTVEDSALFHAMLTDGPVPDFDAGALADEPLHVAETLVLEGCDPGIVEAMDAAIDRLAAQGARISRGPVPEFEAAVGVMRDLSPVVTSEAWAEWGSEIEANPGVMWPPIEMRFRQGKDPDAEKDTAARAEFARISAALQTRIAESGILVMPTSPCFPPPIERLLTDQAYFTERNLLALRNTRLANLLVLSSLTLPTGTSMAGLMLVAPAGAEARLLRIGRAIEKVLT